MNEFNFVVGKKSQRNAYTINNFKYEISNKNRTEATMQISILFTKKESVEGKEKILLAIPGKVSHIEKMTFKGSEFQFIGYVEESIIPLSAEHYRTRIRDDLSTDSISILEIEFGNSLPSGEKILFLMKVKSANIYKTHDSGLDVILEFSNYLSTKKPWSYYPLRIQRGEIWIEIPAMYSHFVDPIPYAEEKIGGDRTLIVWQLSRDDFQRFRRFQIGPDTHAKPQEPEIIPPVETREEVHEELRRTRKSLVILLIVIILLFIIILILL